MERGKFIVIYGANNLGKTVQAKKLAENLNTEGVEAKYLKYPIYDLEPTGPRLNNILRNHSENLTPLQLQKIFAQNRRDYEPTLIKQLYQGTWIVAEDYRRTGVAWGVTFGVPLTIMEKINRDLYPEDLEICLDGERFTGGIERGHLHEESGKWEQNRDVHLMLADKYGWEIVGANRSIETVSVDIWNRVAAKLL